MDLISRWYEVDTNLIWMRYGVEKGIKRRGYFCPRNYQIQMRGGIPLIGPPEINRKFTKKNDSQYAVWANRDSITRNLPAGPKAILSRSSI